MAKQEVPQESATQKRNRIIIIVLIVLAVGLATALVVTNLRSKAESEKSATNKELLEKEIADLDEEIKRMETDLTSSNKEKEEMQADLKELQDKISYYKVQISQLISKGKLAEKEKEEYKGKYEQLAMYNERYRTKIQELEEEIKVLKTQNEEITSKLQKTEGEKKELESEQQINRTKIESGSQLTCADFSYVAMNKKGKEFQSKKDKKDKDATPILEAGLFGKLKSLKACFNINKNTIAPAGKRELYIVIKSSSGKVYQAGGSKSGYFTFNGKETVYTTKTIADYSNNIKKVCADYQLGESDKFEDGTHTIQVFTKVKEGDTETYELGTDKFIIK